MLRVSRWTIYRRVEEYGLGFSWWSNISDDQLDEVIRGFISRHGTTTEQSHLLRGIFDLWAISYSVNASVRQSIGLTLKTVLFDGKQ